jgi:hypothetical protein
MEKKNDNKIFVDLKEIVLNNEKFVDFITILDYLLIKNDTIYIEDKYSVLFEEYKKTSDIYDKIVFIKRNFIINLRDSFNVDFLFFSKGEDEKKEIVSFLGNNNVVFVSDFNLLNKNSLLSLEKDELYLNNILNDNNYVFIQSNENKNALKKERLRELYSKIKKGNINLDFLNEIKSISGLYNFASSDIKEIIDKYIFKDLITLNIKEENIKENEDMLLLNNNNNNNNNNIKENDTIYLNNIFSKVLKKEDVKTYFEIDMSNYLLRTFHSISSKYVISNKKQLEKIVSENENEKQLTTEIKENIKNLFEKTIKKEYLLMLHSAFKNILKLEEYKDDVLKLDNILFFFDNASFLKKEKDLMEYLIESNKNDKAYKGHRVEMIDEKKHSLLKQCSIELAAYSKELQYMFISDVKNHLLNINAKVIEKQKLEADHLISIVTKFINNCQPNSKVIFHSRDEDFKQLLREKNNSFYLPSTEIVSDYEKINYSNFEFFRTESYKDLYLKIIVGDNSDNIPNIFNFIEKEYGFSIQIGETTVSKFIDGFLNELDNKIVKLFETKGVDEFLEIYNKINNNIYSSEIDKNVLLLIGSKIEEIKKEYSFDKDILIGKLLFENIVLDTIIKKAFESSNKTNLKKIKDEIKNSKEIDSFSYTLSTSSWDEFSEKKLKDNNIESLNLEDIKPFFENDIDKKVLKQKINVEEANKIKEIIYKIIIENSILYTTFKEKAITNFNYQKRLVDFDMIPKELIVDFLKNDIDNVLSKEVIEKDKLLDYLNENKIILLHKNNVQEKINK